MTGLPAERVAQASTTYDDAQITPGGVLWVESRADGRDLLVRWTAEHGAQDLIPQGWSVASRVHEYGGGAWAIIGGTVWFCDADRQRLCQVTGDGAVPVDPEPWRPGAVRYGDLYADPFGRHLWAVRERHEPGGVVNELVLIPAAPPIAPRVVASGWDFYAFPRPSPDGRRLAWTCWNAPLMPWDGTCLHVADVDPDGALRDPVLVAGGPAESVFQPQWSPGGVLHFISDRHGWWNLYAWDGSSVVPVLEAEAELGVAQWELGYSTYAFLDGGSIAVIAQRGSRQWLEIAEGGHRRRVNLPWTSIKPYLSAHGSEVAMIASSATEAPRVAVVDTIRDISCVITRPEPAAEPGSVPAPEPFSFAARDGMPVHGLFHQPWPRSGAAPALVIKAHPGPTANVPLRLDWHTQYLLSHGFAVAEIDYRGSTGYGRAFRNALRGQWGEADALDCADGAAYLAGLGHADLRRMAIWGASAGGFTALRALVLTRVFVACIARSPVIDPQSWRDAAPKFQAHHADGLTGPWPQAAPAYQARSILRNAHAITSPVLLLHGEADHVTPANDSRALAQALGDRAQLAIFPGQGHTFSAPEPLRQVLQLELNFLLRTIG